MISFIHLLEKYAQPERLENCIFHVSILGEVGVPLEIMVGDARAGEGYAGVGWTNIQPLKTDCLTNFFTDSSIV